MALGALGAGLLKGMVAKKQYEHQKELDDYKLQAAKIGLEKQKMQMDLINKILEARQNQQQQEDPNAMTMMDGSMGSSAPEFRGFGGQQGGGGGVVDMIMGMSPYEQMALSSATGIDFMGASKQGETLRHNQALEAQAEERNKIARQRLGEINLVPVQQPDGSIIQVPVPKFGNKPAIMTTPPTRERTIPTEDLQMWVNPETLASAPQGITPEQAKEAGYKRLTTEQQKSVADFQSVFNLLDQIETLMNQVFPESETLMQRVMNAPQRGIGAALQTNTAAAKLQKLIKGSMSKIVRAMGERGALAEGDVQRAMNLFPQLFDDADVARESFAQLRKLFQDNFRGVFGQARPEQAPEGAVYGGVNPETREMEYFDAQGNKL